MSFLANLYWNVFAKFNFDNVFGELVNDSLNPAKEQIMSFLDIYPLTFFMHNNCKKHCIQGQKFFLLLLRIYTLQKIGTNIRNIKKNDTLINDILSLILNTLNRCLGI